MPLEDSKKQGTICSVADSSAVSRKDSLLPLLESRGGRHKFVKLLLEALSSEAFSVMQGFIEGKYVPLGPNEDVTASMDIVEADSAETAARLAAEADALSKSA